MVKDTKKVTRSALAEAISERLGISFHKANKYLIELADLVKYELYFNENAVRIFGICQLYRKDEPIKEIVSTGYVSSKTKKTPPQEAIMIEKEVKDIVLSLLKNGYRVVITGLVFLEFIDGKLKCASSPSLRGSQNMTPCRVSLDKVFKKVLKEGGQW